MIGVVFFLFLNRDFLNTCVFAPEFNSNAIGGAEQCLMVVSLRFSPMAELTGTRREMRTNQLCLGT